MEEYDKAVKYVYSLKNIEFAQGYPYLKIIRHRCEAMRCHAQNDKEGEVLHLKKDNCYY